jgi:hypothetical protein
MNHRSLDQAVERLRALSSACGGPQSYDARDS